ncbi:MAG: hypothetical protein GX020_04785 [Firmicutes bacterium]|nr:hypothetical protein [Bacillota bacterium]
MVFEGERVMALYCPACESIQYHTFSIFKVSSEPMAVHCDCGLFNGHVARKGRNYEVSLLSPTGERLRLLFSFREFCVTPILTLYSPLDGEEIGFLGLRELVDEQVEYLNDDFDSVTFQEPSIMSRILARLQELAGSGKINCNCEQPSIAIDLYPDRVELVCSHCGSAILMGATTVNDIDIIHDIDEILMERSSYRYLDEWLKPFT